MGVPLDLPSNSKSMPFPVAAAIVGGASLASTAANIFAQSKTDQATRDWNERMYYIQRDYDREAWNWQNAYNSPANQMHLLKEANLNPNLIYGNGQATQSAGPVRQPDVKPWSPTAPNFSGVATGAAQAIGAYQDFALSQEQLKNMAAQRANMEMDNVLKGLDAAGKGIRNAQTKLDYDRSKELYDTSIAEVQERVRSMQVGTDIAISKEVRDAAMHAPSLAEAFQRVANLQANNKLALQQLANLRKQGTLDQMEINMRKLGLSYNDSVVLRMLAQFAGGQSLPQVVGNLWAKIQELYRQFGQNVKPDPAKDVIEVH